MAMNRNALMAGIAVIFLTACMRNDHEFRGSYVCAEGYILKSSERWTFTPLKSNIETVTADSRPERAAP